ncbi:uncharacterized protein LOC117331140 [Pecten maximus]|uniref:uncharacterized protein LOC117331140 n=1 Tax=Pecten maximus TaxID=6579 RepID=UPI001458BE71|nr:uncharacterized protein LOC117331140 [Pecten maximus]
MAMPGSTTSCRCMEFEPVIKELWSASIAPSTRRSYSTWFDKYIQFLLFSGLIASVYLPNLPVSESYLIQFVAYCFSSNISYATIKLYIGGVRFMCLEKNIPYPYSQEMPRLHSILNGVKRLQVKKTKSRHPITFHILEKICNYLSNSVHDLMLETVCTVAFFGFLRCGEFTVSGCFDPSIHLCIKDLVIVKDCALLTLKRSKTDPFRHGVVIRLFSTNHPVCPYNTCRKYMDHRMTKKPMPSDPLFVNNEGQVLTRPMFMLKHVLELFRQICRSDMAKSDPDENPYNENGMLQT